MPSSPANHNPRSKAKPHKEDIQQWGKGRGGRPWMRRRERIFWRDKYLCQICLDAGLITSVELHGKWHGVCDHKIPLSQGGTDTDDNLQTICQACDKAKTHAESQG